MFRVDEQPETLHIYVVRDEAPKPSLLPIFLSVLALVFLVALAVAIPYEQPVARAVIRAPAVLLPLRSFTATVAIIPTGVKVYPATTAHGVLTITNGSVIAQTIPQGFRLGDVITDASVFVPAGSANGYGYAVVPAHALVTGRSGNIPAYAINQVAGSSIYIRNLSAFSDGRDSYLVQVVIPQDRQTAVTKARATLATHLHGLHYPCKELYVQNSTQITMTWRCKFVSYEIPAYMHVTTARLSGKSVLLDVWFVARQERIGVK